MKKIISVLIICTVLLSGCDMFLSPEQIDERVVEQSKEFHKKFTEEYYYFNYDDMSYEGTYNSKDNSTINTVVFNPVGDADRIKFNNDITMGLSTYDITNWYYTSYVLDDFMFDTTKGNDLETMFRELDKQGIEYHIQDPAVGVISSGWEEYYRHTYATLTNPIMLKPGMTKPLHSDTLIDNFLRTEIVDAYDNESMDKYREYMGFYPVVVIDLVFDEESTETREYYDEWAKQYYNSDIMEVRFGELYKKYELDGETGVMKTEPIDEEDRDTYRYFDVSMQGFDKYGLYDYGYDDTYTYRKDIYNEYDSIEDVNENWYKDNDGVIYPWRDQ